MTSGGGLFFIFPEGLITGLPVTEEAEDIGDLSCELSSISFSNEMLTCGIIILGGILLCLTSFLALVFRFSDLPVIFVGLQRFSEESYIEVMIIGISGEDFPFGDLLKLPSIELALDDLKEGIGIDISL